MNPLMFFFAVVAVGVTAMAQRSTENLHTGHAESVARKGYIMKNRAHAASELDLIVAVRQQNTELLTETLNNVSNPSSLQYGKFLSQDEVNGMVKPLDLSVSQVTSWLQRSGAVNVRPLTPNWDFIGARITVRQAEALLGSNYYVYSHPSHGNITRLKAGTSYSLPTHIAAHVDFIAPTTTFPASVRSHGKAPRAKPAIIPSKLRKLMNLSATDIGKGTAGQGVVQGVASFLNEEYDPKDLSTFRAKYSDLLHNGLTLTVVPKPASQKHRATTEASLDIEYVTTTGNFIQTEMWSTLGKQPGNPDNEPFIKWLTAVASDPSPPSLFSISYGDDEPGVSKEYAMRCSLEFQKAGVRGISLLAASGDSGVGCAAGAFVPTFPASCPYVTGVGATQNGNPGASPSGEVVADLSGGGFSNYFPRPKYQDDAVAEYMRSARLPKSSLYNHDGAGFPDIAAQGILFDTCIQDFFYPYSGTSAACPSATGALALLAQARADSHLTGKLGWLNPLLYKLGSEDKDHAFNDVTEGSNMYCDQDNGFSAAKGWDPVTGWGTLNYGKLKPLFINAGPGPSPPTPPSPSPPSPSPSPSPPHPSPTPPPPSPSPSPPPSPSPSPPKLKCTETSSQKFPCRGQIITTEAKCKAAFGGGKCCWAQVGTDIWCYNPLPNDEPDLLTSLF